MAPLVTPCDRNCKPRPYVWFKYTEIWGGPIQAIAIGLNARTFIDTINAKEPAA